MQILALENLRLLPQECVTFALEASVNYFFRRMFQVLSEECKSYHKDICKFYLKILFLQNTHVTAVHYLSMTIL